MSDSANTPSTSVDMYTRPEMDPSLEPEAMDDEGYHRGDCTVRWVDREPQVVNLCKALWPAASDLEVTKRFVGSFNETIPVTFSLPDSGDRLSFILRLPGFSQEVSVFEQVTTLHYVRTSTSIRVPEIVVYDTSKDNALESPYLILERLRGQDLDEILDDMTAEQRKVLAVELAQLYAQLREATFPCSGRIKPTEACHIPILLPGETLSHIPITVEPYGANVPSTANYEPPTEGKFLDIPKDFIISGGLRSDPPNLCLREMIIRPHNRRTVLWRVLAGDHNTYCYEKHENLRDMAEELVDRGSIQNPSHDFCLVHSDLFPRNIMVEPTSSPMITGIIDWDDAVFAPPFVGSAAPAWLWEPPEPADEGKTYRQTVDETFERSNRVPPTAELRDVKRAFEEAVGPEFVESCTSHHHVMARRILMFSFYFQWPYYFWDLYEKTITEWNALMYPDDSDDEFRDSAEGIQEDDGDGDWETCSEGDSEGDSNDE